MAFAHRLKAILDMAATLAVLAAAGVVLYSGTLGRVPTSGGAPAVYKPGDRFENIPGLTLSNSGPTLVMWVQSRCHFCTESMPFYKTLMAEHARARIVVIGVEPVDVLQKYLSDHMLIPDQIVSVPQRSVKLAGTPTLVLVGADGVVRSVWPGKLPDAAAEVEVRRRVAL